MAKSKKPTSEDPFTETPAQPVPASPEDATSITRVAGATTVMEPVEPPPIDPMWDPPPPPPEDHEHPGAVSPYSAGDTVEHGTEFPPRIFALGPEGTVGVSTLLGPTTRDEAPPKDVDPDATAITRPKQFA